MDTLPASLRASLNARERKQAQKQARQKAENRRYFDLPKNIKFTLDSLRDLQRSSWVYLKEQEYAPEQFAHFFAMQIKITLGHLHHLETQGITYDQFFEAIGKEQTGNLYESFDRMLAKLRGDIDADLLTRIKDDLIDIAGAIDRVYDFNFMRKVTRKGLKQRLERK